MGTAAGSSAAGSHPAADTSETLVSGQALCQLSACQNPACPQTVNSETRALRDERSDYGLHSSRISVAQDTLGLQLSRSYGVLRRTSR